MNFGLVGKAALGTLAAGTVCTVGIASWFAKQLTKPKSYTIFEARGVTPFEFAADFEVVEVKNYRNENLHGWFLRNQTNKVIVVANGFQGRMEEGIGISTILWRNGYNVLMFDYKGHGPKASKKEVVTLGYNELEDFQAAVDYVCDRIPNAIVGAVGGSMGASIVIEAASRDNRIKAIWVDSPFARLEDIIREGLVKGLHLPAWPIFPVSEFFFKRRTGHTYRDFQPIQGIAKIAPRPIYITHSAGDPIIPVKHSKELFEAAQEPKSLWIEEVDEHCGNYYVGRSEYADRVVKFFAENLVVVSQKQENEPANIS